MLPTQGLSPSEISMGQASLDALKVAETITLTGKDFPAFGTVVVTAGGEKLQASGASGNASATIGKPVASLTATMADTSSGVIGNPGINSISAASNPIGSGAVAVASIPETAKASNTSTAKQAATTVNKSSASGISVASGCFIVAGALAVVLLL